MVTLFSTRLSLYQFLYQSLSKEIFSLTRITRRYEKLDNNENVLWSMIEMKQQF